MLFDSLIVLSRLHPRSSPSRASAPAVPALGFAADVAPGSAYTEDTFRHFLEVERRRVERSKRSSLLLLVSLRGVPGGTGRLSRTVSRAMFRALEQCVREVDFFGWYREGRVAAAVLPQSTSLASPETRVQVAARARAELSAQLPASVAERLRVRVVCLRK